MLLLGSRLLNTPIMSLQTGTRLAHTAKAIINPANLRVVAYEVSGPLLSQTPSFIRTNDIREYGQLGMIIDSNDELVGPDDVIEIQKVQALHFNLLGMPVVDERKRKLGKVEDYTLETGNFVIEQLTVKRGFLKGITDTGFLVNRSQIIEINNSMIVIKSPTEKSPSPIAESLRTEFVNPFRSAKPQSNADASIQSRG